MYESADTRGWRRNAPSPDNPHRAEQLVLVGNKPILEFGIKAIRDAGITDVGIIVGDTCAEIQAMSATVRGSTST